MNIQGPSSIHGIQGVKGPHSANRASGSKPAQSASGPADQVDISAAGEAAAQAAEGGVRADLVARVRSEIAAGTYETPEKLDAALDGLLNELG
ncbi:MAG: flagellar biosynthesis anti-sigma factor FlgM [Planctomycetota bacterium]